MKDDVTDPDDSTNVVLICFFSPHTWFSDYFSVLRVVSCQGRIAEC